MEKRKVTVSIGGQPCSFYSDDSEEYISALENRVNAAMKQTARFSGASGRTNAILAELLLADQLLRTEQLLRAEQLLRTEQKGSRKPAPKAEEKNSGQVSVWDLIGDRTP